MTMIVLTAISPSTSSRGPLQGRAHAQSTPPGTDSAGQRSAFPLVACHAGGQKEARRRRRGEQESTSGAMVQVQVTGDWQQHGRRERRESVKTPAGCTLGIPRALAAVPRWPLRCDALRCVVVLLAAGCCPCRLRIAPSCSNSRPVLESPSSPSCWPP